MVGIDAETDDRVERLVRSGSVFRRAMGQFYLDPDITFSIKVPGKDVLLISPNWAMSGEGTEYTYGKGVFDHIFDTVQKFITTDNCEAFADQRKRSEGRSK